MADYSVGLKPQELAQIAKDLGVTEEQVRDGLEIDKKVTDKWKMNSAKSGGVQGAPVGGKILSEDADIIRGIGPKTQGKLKATNQLLAFGQLGNPNVGSTLEDLASLTDSEVATAKKLFKITGAQARTIDETRAAIHSRFGLNPDAVEKRAHLLGEFLDAPHTAELETLAADAASASFAFARSFQMRAGNSAQEWQQNIFNARDAAKLAAGKVASFVDGLTVNDIAGIDGASKPLTEAGMGKIVDFVGAPEHEISEALRDTKFNLEKVADLHRKMVDVITS